MTVVGPAAMPVGRRWPGGFSIAWVALGAIGWAAIATLATQMLSTRPPTAGFDLELLLEAGRRVAAGHSPYDPALVAGAIVQAESLFYSYPPPVAQAMSLLAGIPTSVVLAAWMVGATAALTGVGVVVARRLGWPAAAWRIALPIAATAPFVFPYAIAVLFGNLDAWFPALYGVLLLGALSPSTVVTAGLALAGMSVAKLHPASLGVWFLFRGANGRRIVVIAVMAVIATVGLSLLVGGLDPWRDYLAVVRAGSRADLIDRRNIGPAVQLGLLAGLDESGVRVVQAFVSIGALVLTALVALRRSDSVESLAWAATASLATLPVTWFHYPAVLIPFALAAVVRSGDASADVRARTRALVAAAVAVSVVAIAFAPAVWLAVALVLFAVRVSGAGAATKLPR